MDKKLFLQDQKMTKEWNFDEIIDRSNTASLKWEPSVLGNLFSRNDLLPLWVADMDFNCPTTVTKAIKKRLEHEIYGYNLLDPDYLPALISWYKRRHNWTMKEEWVLTTPGVVPAINYIIQRLSQPGDNIIIQPPVYYPFANAIKNNGRQILENPLKIVNDHYQMDFDDLEQKAKDPRAKLAILCSPHNPVGRVWTKDELETFGDICIQNNILIIADEIHCDLLMPGFRHTCFADINEAFAQNSITCLAASKTFNLAGLRQSAIIMPNNDICKEMAAHIENLGFTAGIGGTLFGAIATAAAYNGAEPWLDDLILYLKNNFTYLKTTLESELPGVRVFNLEGTYLAWTDFRCFGLTGKKQVELLEGKAGVALDHGDWFGENGNGFERINIACPQAILERALETIVQTFKPLVKGSL